LTYRYYGHHQTDDTRRYRLPGEEEAARARDCVALLRARLESLGVAQADELEAIEAENKALLEQAVVFARSSDLPPASELTTDVYVPAPGER
jgi:pyruvate dehydrogenase E1 component alpha subunit